MSETKSAFADDCFGRKEFADNLLKLIKNQKDYESRVIAIKADFGLGKTFFAKELEKLMGEHLNNLQDLPKIYPHYINIWKDDYTNEPLLALLYALENIADKYQNLWNKKTIRCIKNKFWAIFESTPKFGKFIAKAKNNLKEIKENNKFDNIESYKNITDNIEKAFKRHNDKKFVIIIDEIDRCIPEYAIRFLETLKHFFDIQGLYFILMFNEKHLQKSIKKQFCYIDFTLWKDKFIDLEFDLSIFHNQENFIEYLVKKYDIKVEAWGRCMYITYDLENSGGDLNASGLFGRGWASYISRFLNSLNIKDLNYRQLNTLCLRLSLAIEILQYKNVLPDCLMCVIIKDMFGNKRLEIKQGYNNIPFTYNDKTKGRQHIIELFNGGIIDSPISLPTFSAEMAKRYYNGDTLELTINEHTKSIVEANKKAAEFAILADKAKE